MKFKSNLFLTTTIVFALALITSCSSSNNSIIATSVALTIQAQNTPAVPATEATVTTETPLPLATGLPLAGTSTPISTVISPTASGTFTALNCSIVANFVSENFPDGTIKSPSAQFTKTWNIQNNGTCTWDTSWEIVYDKGDLLGGGYVYNFPQAVAPGQTVPISLVLTAPAEEGIYTGYWLLEAPNGTVFGVGQSGNVPLSVNINVNGGTRGPYTPSVYGITSITYDYSVALSKNGTCSPNVFLTTYATISVSGPMIFYRWKQSDGGSVGPFNHTFTEAGSVTVQDTWPLAADHEIGIRWEEIAETSPIVQDFVNTYARYDHECQ